MFRALATAIALAAATPGVAWAGVASAESRSITESGKGGPYTYEAITVTYTAAPGEANDLRVTNTADTVTITDAAGVTAGAGCVPVESPEPTVTCRWGGPLTQPMNNLVVLLGDGDDRLSFGARASGGPSLVDAGPGDDHVTGSASFETIQGGDGNDTLDGRGGGYDVLFGGDGADVFLTGADTTVSYADHSSPVFVDLRTLDQAGSAGENDRIEGAPPAIAGGQGNDVLHGTDRDDVIDGASGDDRITAGDGDDRLDGGPGADLVDAGPGSDQLEAGGGADVLEGGPGNDALFGLDARDVDDAGATYRGGPGDDLVEAGAGSDTIDGGPGRDDLYGFTGNDRYLARDGAPDAVTCAFSFDPRRGSARVDDGDMTSGCAHVNRPHPAHLLVLSHARTRLRYGPSRRLTLRVGCPSDHPRHCRGTLVARDGRGSVLARGTFDAPPGGGADATALAREPILRRGRAFAVRYALRTTDARGKPVVVHFRRVFTRAR